MELEITTLDREWHDADEVMLHACFQCLVNWVEKENGLTSCNYNSHREQLIRCQLLYNWWIAFNNSEEGRRGIYNNANVDAMLQKLINIRGFLWT